MHLLLPMLIQFFSQIFVFLKEKDQHFSLKISRTRNKFPALILKFLRGQRHSAYSISITSDSEDACRFSWKLLTTELISGIALPFIIGETLYVSTWNLVTMLLVDNCMDYESWSTDVALTKVLHSPVSAICRPNSSCYVFHI